MSDGSRLCLSCALCCSGALFDVVRLFPEDVPRMTALGLPILHRGEFTAMEQPCAALAGCACRVYAERPTRCLAYKCHLLAALESDEVSLPEALGVVTLAKELEGAQREQFIDRHFLGRRSRRK